MILVLIAGVGGSGKTTCMQQLSELLPNSASFCVDEYKELLYNSIGFNNSNEKKRLGEIAFDLVYHTIRNIEDRDYILIDYPYSSTRIDKLNEFIETLSGCKVITVRTKGDLELFYQRYRDRIRSPYRHKGHSSNRFPCGLDDLVEKNEHPDHRDVRRVVEDPVRNHVAHKRVAKNAGKVLLLFNKISFDPTSIFNEGRPKVK